MRKLKENNKVKKGNTLFKKILKRGAIIGGYVVVLNVAQQLNVFAADDPITVVNNLSNFIFGLIRAVGMIILGFGVVQVGMSLKSHDPTQRANRNNDFSWRCSNNICQRSIKPNYRWLEAKIRN